MVGLTPPGYQSLNGSLAKFGEMQRAVYDFYRGWMELLHPIDLLIVNGDCIEGKGERSGGTELIEADRTEQAKMAVRCIEEARAEKIVITYGTPYHTGVTEDFEMQVADGVNAMKIGGHEWIEVNGVIFDCKHFIGSSAVPHARNTAVARDVLWNQLWSIDEQQPLANVIIRSHVHYFGYHGGVDYLAMTTPAFQGYGSKYGVRKCSGRVDIGLVWFKISDQGEITWKPEILKTELQKVQVLQL
jgi:hypothetical protein